jgi:E3 ubiquitin-protein ligase HERC3
VAVLIHAAVLQAVVMPVPAKVSRLDPMHLAPADRITAIASGGNHCMALTVGGTLWGFGRNKHGALGTNDTEDKWKPTKVEMAASSEQSKCIRAVQVVCGASHTLALTSNHGVLEVRACGHNSWGQLGMGDRRDRHRMSRVAKAPSGISAVQAGDDHSGAVVGDGSLWVWGRGDCGQLAVGDDRSKWSPTLVKGFKVVHPDRTLRRNKRNQPRMRPMKPAAAEKPKGEHCFGAPMM